MTLLDTIIVMIAFLDVLMCLMLLVSCMVKKH